MGSGKHQEHEVTKSRSPPSLQGKQLRGDLVSSPPLRSLRIPTSSLGAAHRKPKELKWKTGSLHNAWLINLVQMTDLNIWGLKVLEEEGHRPVTFKCTL